MSVDAGFTPFSARPQGFQEEQIERIRTCWRARFMKEVISNRSVPDVVAVHADVQHPRRELAVFRTPCREPFVVTIDGYDVVAPERLIATLNTAQRSFDSRCCQTQQYVADRIWALL